MSIRNRSASITEEYSPQYRRKLGNNIFNMSMPNWIPQSEQSENENNRGDVDINLHQIRQNQEKIHQIIDKVDTFMKKRMQVHEVELISIVRKEIDKMHEDTALIVKRYNAMIDEKNKQMEIIHLNNQLEYFRTQALSLFEINRQMKKELQKLRETNLKYRHQVESLKAALNNVGQKYQRNKVTIKQLKKQISNSFLTFEEEKKEHVPPKEWKQQQNSKERKLNSTLMSNRLRTEFCSTRQDAGSLTRRNLSLRGKHNVIHRQSLHEK